MTLNIGAFSRSENLKKPAFVQLKNPETGELEFTKKEQVNPDTKEVELVDDKKIGVELYSTQSPQFKRALRSTAHLALDKDEQARKENLDKLVAEGVSISDEDLDFLEHCEQKTVKRMQCVFAKVTTKLHNITLKPEDAELMEVDITASGKVKESVENIHKLYIHLPDLSAQIGDGMTDQQNFMKA
jgi:hypothetical protein